jgi:hypothetical protein
MKIFKIVLVASMLVASVSIAYAGEYRRQRRQPSHETYETDRWVESTRSGGRGNQGTIHFKTKTKIRREYRDRKRRKQVCRTEKGKVVPCR